MYDTIALTQAGKPEIDFKLKNLDAWEDERSAGVVMKYKKNIPLNVKLGKHNGSLFIGYNNIIKALKVSAALPKLLYGSSLYEIQPEDGDKVKEAILNTTKDWIEVDLDKMKLFRLDNSVNLQMDEKTKKYIYALNNNTSDKIGHRIKGHFEGETLRFASNAQTDMFYDKIKEEEHLKGRQYDYEAYKFRGKNILRYEIQNKTDEAIKTVSRYGRNLYFKDLFTDEVISRTCKLRVDGWENILRSTKQKYVLDYSSITRDLETMRELKINRSTLSDFAWYLVMRAGILSIDDMQKILRGAGFSRQSIHNHTKRVKKLEGIKSKENYLIDELNEKIKRVA